MPTYHLSWPGHSLLLGRRTCVMGIVNVTPDSFSDGGRFFSCDAAVDQGLRLVDEGADILDIGGESTRPYSDPVPEAEELQRVLPVIERLTGRIAIPISIDTTKAGVADRALAAGASLINDVSALRADPAMAEVARRRDVPIVLMHMLGAPKTMQVKPHYQDVVAEVCGFLEDAVARALAAGIPRERIVVDPGIGFGKSFAHNLTLIRNLDALMALGVPLLVGVSRKAFIRHLLKPPGAEDIDPEGPLVAIGTQAAVAAAVLKGAHIVRVHDVAQTRATLGIIDAIRGA